MSGPLLGHMESSEPFGQSIVKKDVSGDDGRIVGQEVIPVTW